MWTVTANKDHQVVIIRSDCIFNYQKLLELLGKIYIENACKFVSYDGFADLSDIEIIDDDIDGVVEAIQQFTQLIPQDRGNKVAVCLPFGLRDSFAQIYKLITENNTKFILQIYSSVVECAEYLHVDQRILA